MEDWDLQDCIDYLGLQKCEFNDECDFCEKPTGEFSYCEIVSGIGYTETNFYICEKCIPEKAKNEIERAEADFNHYFNLVT